MRKSTVKSLKKKAWKAFSEYIRRKYATKSGYVRCYTCDKKMHWKEAQAGHAVAGRGNSILFCEDAVRVQCQRCNIWLGGNYTPFHIKLQKELGNDILEKLYALSKKPRPFTVGELEEIYLLYKGYCEKISGISKKARSSTTKV